MKSTPLKNPPCKAPINRPVFTMQSIDALLDKLGAVIRQRDTAIRLAFILAPDGSTKKQDMAFAELFALKEQITRQNTTKTKKVTNTTAPIP